MESFVAVRVVSYVIETEEISMIVQGGPKFQARLLVGDRHSTRKAVTPRMLPPAMASVEIGDATGGVVWLSLENACILFGH